MKVPWSYELKRIAPKHARRFWRSDLLAGIQRAPAYLFPDQAAFDSDEVDQAARALMDELPRLPHADVIFEVADQYGRLDSRSFVRGRSMTALNVFISSATRYRGDGPTSLCTPGSRNQGLPRSK